MPTYSVTAPDGRKLKITGDTPPSEKELDQIFKESSQTAQPESKSFLSKAIDIPSQISYGAQESMGMEPKETPFPEPQTGLGGAGKLIGKGLGFIAPTPGMASGLENAIAPALGYATKRIMQTAPVTFAKKIIKPVADVTKEGLSYFGSLASSVPEWQLKHATEKEIVGDSIFKGNFIPEQAYRKVGEKAQRAINFINKQAGESVSNEVKNLKGINTPININDTLKMMSDLKASAKRGRMDILESKDHSMISQIENDILNLETDPKNPGVYAEELHAIKKKIDNMVSWSSESVNMPTEAGENILKSIRANINGKLREISKGYAKANDKSASTQELRDRVNKKLKDANLSRNMSSMINTEDNYYTDILDEIDKYSPKNLKFMDDLKNVATRDSMSKFFSGRGGGSGSAQGAANLLRTRAISGAMPKSSDDSATKFVKAIGSIAMYPLVSPQGQKHTIRGGVKIAKQTRKLIKSSEAFIPGISRGVMGSEYQGGE